MLTKGSNINDRITSSIHIVEQFYYDFEIINLLVALML